MTGAGARDDWRSAGVVEALARHLEVVPPEGSALILADTGPGAYRLLKESGVPVGWWSRRVAPGATVSPWPRTSCRTAALRLPRGKEELEMLVHAAASVLEPGGALLVYGANDEGIRSAAFRIEPVFGSVETVSVKSRCRVLRARRPRSISDLRGELAAWRSTWRLRIEGEGKERGGPTARGGSGRSGGRRAGDRPWVSYPGVFSHGRLDAGTRLLLDVIDVPEAGARVLDYGCGSGVIAGVLAARSRELDLHLLDADAIALEAARENLPDGRRILADRIDVVGDVRFDLVVSNPPYHAGKAEDRGILQALIRDSPAHLAPGGSLVMVVQRRFPVEGPLGAAFRRVDVLGEDATYRVWRGEKPLGR